LLPPLEVKLTGSDQNQDLKKKKNQGHLYAEQDV
jgi:hypothetical protein